MSFSSACLKERIQAGAPLRLASGRVEGARCEADLQCPQIALDIGIVAQRSRRRLQRERQPAQLVDDARQSVLVVDAARVAEEGHGLLRGERLQGDAVARRAPLPHGVDRGDQDLAAVPGVRQQLADRGVVLGAVVDQQRPGPGQFVGQQFLEGLFGVPVVAVRRAARGLVTGGVQPVREIEKARAGGRSVRGLYPPDDVEEVLVPAGVLKCQAGLADPAEPVDRARPCVARDVDRAEDLAQLGQFLAAGREVGGSAPVEVADQRAQRRKARFDLADDVGGRVRRERHRAGLVQTGVDGGGRVVGGAPGQRQHLAAGPARQRRVVVRGHQNEG